VLEQTETSPAGVRYRGRAPVRLARYRPTAEPNLNNLTTPSKEPVMSRSRKTLAAKLRLLGGESKKKIRAKRPLRMEPLGSGRATWRRPRKSARETYPRLRPRNSEPATFGNEC